MEVRNVDIPKSNKEYNCTSNDEDFCDISPDEVVQTKSLSESFGESSFGSLDQDFQRVDVLRPDEVRWFYFSKKKNKWRPFVGYDSIRLERAWRKQHLKSNENIKKVCVRGGMFEVDVKEKVCNSIYWISDDDQVMRGSWFFKGNWQPLDEDLAERIEEEHFERWKGCNLDHVKELQGKNVMHTVQLEGCHVEWSSVSHVLFYKDATAHRAIRNFAQTFLRVSKETTSGHHLHRGYKEDAMEEDVHLPVTNLVFVIHGIGSKNDRRKIVRNTRDFRALCKNMEKKYFEDDRSEFIAIEWRSKLTLDGELLDLITPKKALGVRKFLNDTAMDILYYTSQKYRFEIVNSLCSELNRIHGMYMKKNPDFNGKICVLAHSLGNVIFHDILTKTSENLKTKKHIKDRQSEILNFKTDILFSVGSPLGVFLCLRGINGNKGDLDNIIPTSLCSRVINIFHPCDPVAYRLEPLVDKLYAERPPVQIKTFHSKEDVNDNKLLQPPSPQEEVEEEEEVEQSERAEEEKEECEILEEKKEDSGYIRSVAGGAVRIGRGLWSRARGTSPPSLESSSSIELPSSPLLPDSLDKRIDFELQEGFTESKLGYGPLTAHTSYWQNQDLGKFVISQLNR